LRAEVRRQTETYWQGIFFYRRIARPRADDMIAAYRSMTPLSSAIKNTCMEQYLDSKRLEVTGKWIEVWKKGRCNVCGLSQSKLRLYILWINRWYLNLLLCHCFLHVVTTEAEAFICRVTSCPVRCWCQYVSFVISHLALNYLHLALICKFVAVKILLECLKQTVTFWQRIPLT
jgi:hypothetical protein